MITLVEYKEKPKMLIIVKLREREGEWVDSGGQSKVIYRL